MKKTIVMALSIFALANIPAYTNAEEAAAPTNQTETLEAPSLQNTDQTEKKQPEKTEAVKGQKSKKAEKAELPTKKANSEVGGRGIKLPATSGAADEKTKKHDNCTCDASDTSLPYCGKDAC